MTADTPTELLPNYDLEADNLNKNELAFKEFLREVKARYPRRTKIIVKQREPLVNKEGFLEVAYVMQKDRNTIYMVIPKIDSKEKLSHGIHEACHLKHFHQDPRKLGGTLDPYTKELEVEICSRNYFEGKFKYGREMIDILNNYYRG